MGRTRIVILGAAGRDFHDFNVRFRSDESTEVVAFTAAQIPNIAGRHYPAALAGPLYPEGIPIRPESELEQIVGEHGVREAIFSYSDLPHESVMHLASRVLVAGAVVADSTVTAEDASVIRGRRVLVIEDGPTLTHGGMAWGAGKVAAERNGAAAIVDPRPFATGSIARLYAQYPHLGNVVPAMGYYPEQIAELEQTVLRSDCDAVVVGTPIDLGHLIRFDRPSTRVRYELTDREGPTLAAEIEAFLQHHSGVQNQRTPARGERAGKVRVSR